MNRSMLAFEWRALRADRAALLAGALFTVTLAYALFNGWQWTAFQRETIAGIQQDERARITKLQTQIEAIEIKGLRVSSHSDPRLPGVVGMNAGALHATLPPHPLGHLSIGQSDLHPYYYKVTTRGRSSLPGSDEIENPLHLLSGRFDAAFAVIYLLPLFVLALTYNLISGERENGTLAMVLSNPVSLAGVLLAKLAVRYLLVAAVLAAAALFAAFSGGPAALPAVALWLLAVLLYAAFWFAAAVFVNSFGRSSSSNAVLLATVWLGFVLLIPLLSGLAAQSIYPVPSRVEMIQAMRAATTDANRQGGKILARYFEEHPDLLPASGQPDPTDFMARFIAVQDAVERKMRPVLDAYDLQLEKQQALAARFQFLSPASLMQETLNDISGTSPYRFRHFRAQVEQYQAEWSQFFAPKVFQQVRLKPADLEALPRFSYRPEPLSHTAARVSGALALLAAAAFALFLLATARLKQFPIVAALALLAFLQAPATAQNINGAVTGSVLGPDGAALSNAIVKLSQNERAFTRSTTTNDAGQYRIGALTPGLYEMSVAAPGFAPYKRERIEVQVGAPLQLDVTLTVASLNETVTVTAEVTDLDRALTTGTRGALINSELIDNLPTLAGRASRNYSAFVFLLPGTNVSRTPHAPFSVNGARGQGTTNVMVDGADFNNPNSGSLLGANFTEQPVSQEALQSVEVQTSTFKAEYGRAAGGTINLITPSGSNQFHGRFYEFVRNDALDARNPMNAERPTLRQNQFGGLITGPIMRDRLFFSLNGEWNLQRAANSAVPQATFSQAERDRAVPQARALLDLFPLPNAAGPGNTPLFDPGRVSEVLTGRTWFGKLDYVINPNHQFGYRYTHVESLRRAANLFGTGSAGWNEVYSHTFNLISTLTPSIVNEARAYYTTYNIPLWPLTRFLGNPAINGEVGLMTITGAASTGTIFRDESRTHNYQVQNDLSINRGRHGLKLGVIGRRVFVNTTSRSLGDGQLVFDSRELFLQGRPRTYTRVLGDTRLDQVMNEWGFYGQSDWRVRPNLTLNLGMRYEFYTPPADANRLEPNYRTDWNNFAPRFGFAWSPGKQTSFVLRGGYGLFYAPLAARYVGLTRLTPPRVRTVIALNPVLGNLLGGPLVDSTNLTVTDPNLRQPYTQQWNLTTEWRLPGSSLVASLGYVGTRGTALPMTRLPNGGDRLAQNLRPDPTRGVVTLLETAANSTYHALQFQLSGNLTRALTIRTAYTWSKSIDDVSRDTVNIIAQNNRRLDRAVSEFDVPHNFTTALVYRLPNLRVLKTVTNGWQLSPIVQFRSGYPFSLLSGGDTPEGVRNNRINFVPGAMSLPLAQLRAAVTPAPGAFGTLGRNTFRAENYADLSMSLQKEFALTERFRLQLRGEAFNMLNMTNLDTYATNLLDPRFGQPITAYPARAVQLALRLSF